MIGYLYDCGPVLSGGMGEGPLTHSEIESWQRNSGVELEPWETSFLRKLSIEYLSQSQKSDATNCPAPWNTEALRQHAAQSFKESIEALAKQ